jgi:hypothetical protein
LDGGGLLETIRPLIKGTQVVLETIDSTPDGFITSFSGTLANFPCTPRRLVITYTISGTPYTCSDDGMGNISDDGTPSYLTSGTIVHADGSWTLTFNTPPDNLSDITATYWYGIPGRDWVELVYRNSRNSVGNDVALNDGGAGHGWTPGSCKEAIFHNTGLSGTEDVYIGIREWKDVPNNAYGWDLNVYTNYTPAQQWNANSAQHGHSAFSATYNHWSEMPLLPLANSTMGYWLFSNRQRIIVGVRAASRYQECYLGFMRRYGTPTQYSCPGVAKGTHYGDINYTNVNCKMIANVGTSSGYSLLGIRPDNTYFDLSGSHDMIMPPRYNFDATPGIIAPTATLNRTPMTPVYIAELGTANVLYGDLDGVKLAFSNGITAEDVMTADSIKHIIFPDPNLNNYYDWIAIEQEYQTTTS